MQTMATISVQELSKLAEQGEVDLIDVRTPVEFREVHAVGARNVPLDTLDPKHLATNGEASGERAAYLICRSGNRSEKACEKLQKAGCKNVVSVEGGTSAWDAAGLPVVRGKKAISLERQVRIVAGFLVLLGVLLSFLSPYFLILSGFVGAGLMFAGITDTCGMAMMLAKMPWNKVGKSEPNQCAT